jgi:hypothetical protein
VGVESQFWDRETYEFLGIHINRLLEWDELWDRTSLRLSARLKLLSSLKATPRGKAEAINALGLSLLNYPMQCVTFPLRLLYNWQKLALSSLTRGMLGTRFPIQVVTLRTQQGGLDLWNLRARQRCLYVNTALGKYLNSPNEYTRLVASLQLEDYVRKGHMDRLPSGRIIPPTIRESRQQGGDSPLILVFLCNLDSTTLLAPLGAGSTGAPRPMCESWNIEARIVCSDASKSRGSLSIGWAEVGASPPQAVSLPDATPGISWAEMIAIAHAREIAPHMEHLLTDAQSVDRNLRHFRDCPRKDRRKVNFNNVLAYITHTVRAPVIWIPAHTLESPTTDPAKVDALERAAACTGVDQTCLAQANARADAAAKLKGPHVKWSHEDLREYIRGLTPSDFMLEVRGWGAVVPPIKDVLRRNRDVQSLEQTRSLPAWGKLWRCGNQVYWKAIKLAWSLRARAKRAMVSFVYNALFGLVATPEQTAYQAWDFMEEEWAGARSNSLCPACSEGSPVKASLRHILVDCVITARHRMERDTAIASLIAVTESQAELRSGSINPVAIRSWLLDPGLRDSDGSSCPAIWGSLGVITKKLAASLKAQGIPKDKVLPFCGTLAQITLFWAQASMAHYKRQWKKIYGLQGPAVRTVMDQLSRAGLPAYSVPPAALSQRWRLVTPRKTGVSGGRTAPRPRGRPKGRAKKAKAKPTDGNIWELLAQATVPDSAEGVAFPDTTTARQKRASPDAHGAEHPPSSRACAPPSLNARPRRGRAPTNDSVACRKHAMLSDPEGEFTSPRRPSPSVPQGCLPSGRSRGELGTGGPKRQSKLEDFFCPTSRTFSSPPRATELIADTTEDTVPSQVADRRPAEEPPPERGEGYTPGAAGVT